MQSTVTVRESENGLLISLEGEREYVKIVDAATGQVILHSMGPGVTDIRHVVKPGRYVVETDGTITESRRLRINVAENIG
jgi:hypothetical protein